MHLSWDSSWTGLVLVATLWNGLALLATTEERTAHIIRSESETLYLFFNREADRKRAENAEVVAEGAARWVRLGMLLAVNTMVVLAALDALRRG